MLLPEPGDRVGGYTIHRLVREGSTGRLYIAHRVGAPGFAPFVALKLVAPELVDTPDKSASFDAEIIRASKVDDPRIVRLDELGDDRGKRYVAMECVRGFSLSDMLAFYYERDRRIRPGLAAHIAMQVALGLQTTHEARDSKGSHLHLVHGGLTTKKVLVTWKGHVKVVRLGFARPAAGLPVTSADQLFRAPEAGNLEDIDGRADVYSLGAVLLASLARGGLPVLEGAIELAAIPDALARAQGIPPAVGSALVHALQPRREDRPTALMFYRELVDAIPEALKVTPSDVARELAAIRLDKEFGAFAQDRSLVGASYVPPRMTEVPSPFVTAPPGASTASLAASEKLVVPALPALPVMSTMGPRVPGASAAPPAAGIPAAAIPAAAIPITTLPSIEEAPRSPDPLKTLVPTGHEPPSEPALVAVKPVDAPAAPTETESAADPPPTDDVVPPPESSAAILPRARVDHPAPAVEAEAAEAEVASLPRRAGLGPTVLVAVAFAAGVLLTLLFGALRTSGRTPETFDASPSGSYAPGAQLFAPFQSYPASSVLRILADGAALEGPPGPGGQPMTDAALLVEGEAGADAAADAGADAADAADASPAEAVAGDTSTIARAEQEGDVAFTTASARVLAGDVVGGRAILEARLAKATPTADELALLRAICKQEHDGACLDRLRDAKAAPGTAPVAAQVDR